MSYSLRELDFQFNIIEVSETRIYNDTCILALTQIFLIITSGLFQHPFLLEVLDWLYIDEIMNYTVFERTCNEAFLALSIELQFAKQSNIICGVILGNIIPWIVS